MYKQYDLAYTFEAKDLPLFQRQKGAVDNVQYLTVLVRLQFEFASSQDKVVASIVFQGENRGSITMDLMPPED